MNEEKWRERAIHLNSWIVWLKLSIWKQNSIFYEKKNKNIKHFWFELLIDFSLFVCQYIRKAMQTIQRNPLVYIPFVFCQNVSDHNLKCKKMEEEILFLLCPLMHPKVNPKINCSLFWLSAGSMFPFFHKLKTFSR